MLDAFWLAPALKKLKLVHYVSSKVTFDDRRAIPVAEAGIHDHVHHEHKHCEGKVSEEVKAIHEACTASPVEDKASEAPEEEQRQQADHAQQCY